MLESLKRLVDMDGLPKVKHSSPQDFFGTVDKEDSGNLCRWVGELYLELHRGTYTTHAKVRTRSLCITEANAKQVQISAGSITS